jgi:hypothetical protein
LFVFCHMRYLSPTLLFGKNFQLPFDSRTLQRERKKLLAELELTGADALAINGRSFTRNELIDYFEELQQENIATWHLAVADDPVLLRFLQDAAIKAGAFFKDAAIFEDADFIDWISPYFRSAFTSLVTTCFEQRDALGMRAILDNELLMTVDDNEQCWLFIAAILERNIALFDHYKGRGKKTSPPMMSIRQISDFIGFGYVEVIRQLPDSRFARLKDDYAFSMQHPSIAVFNRDVPNRSLAIIWVEEALNLAVSASVKAGIQAKLVELKLLKTKRRIRLKRPWLFIVYGIFVLVGMIANFFDNSHSKDSFIRTLTPDSTSSPAQPSIYIAPSDSVIVRAKRKDSTHRK